MANRVTMGICGQDYTLVADENASYMEKVGAMVDKKMRELMDTAHVSRSDAAVLAAINLADELLKNQEASENLRRQKSRICATVNSNGSNRNTRRHLNGSKKSVKSVKC